MKSNLLILLSLIFLISCKSNEEEQIKESNEDTETEEIKLKTETADKVEDSDRLCYMLSGEIDGKYPIHMRIEKGEKNEITGYYFYETSGADMQIKGTISGNNLLVNEFNSEDRKTGNFDGIFEDGKYTGLWSNSDKSKEMPFELRKINYTGLCNTVKIIETALDITEYPDMKDYIYPAFTSSNSTLEKRINYVYSFEGLTGYSVKDITEQIKMEEEDGMMKEYSELSYDINYKSNCILSFSTTVETVAAHLNYFSENHNLSLINGTEILIFDIIKEDKIPELISLCNEELQKIIEKELNDGDYSDDEEIMNMLEGREFTEYNIHNFYFDEEGLVFNYNFDFPHACLAAEPCGRIFTEYETLKQFAKDDGPLHYIFN